MNDSTVARAFKIIGRLCLYLCLATLPVSAQGGDHIKLKPGEVRLGFWQMDSEFCQLWPMNWLGQKDYLLFSELPEIPQSWAESNYFKTQKPDRVYDPQGYLSAIEVDVIIDMLKNHSNLSQIPMSVYVFGKGQKAGKLTPQAVCEQFFGDENVAVLFYFINDPHATKGFIKLKQSESREELDEYLVKTLYTKAGAQAELLQVDEKETMYATVAEVSQRMFWIENDLGLVRQPASVVDDYKEKIVEETPSMLEQAWQQLGGSKGNLAYFAGGASLAVLLLFLALGLQIHRRVKIYRFPEYKGTKRLGAEYGAGVGEVVAFSDPQQSLLEQKKQIKELEL